MEQGISKDGIARNCSYYVWFKSPSRLFSEFIL